MSFLKELIWGFNCEEEYPMSPEQIEKSLKQMRSRFGHFTLGSTSIVGIILSQAPLEPFTLFILTICLIYATMYGAAYHGLGQRTPRGYKLARIGCKLLFSARGYHSLARCYLRKLDRPEMKRVFNK